MTILGVFVKRAGGYEDMTPAPSWVKVRGQYLPWDQPSVVMKANGVYDLGNGVIPTNITPPDITGPNANPGTTLTCTPGTWDGNPDPVITHQWQRDGADIPGETGLTYVIQEADRGFAVSCQERGTNLVGSVVVSSSAVFPPDTAFSNEFTAEFH